MELSRRHASDANILQRDILIIRLLMQLTDKDDEKRECGRSKVSGRFQRPK